MTYKSQTKPKGVIYFTLFLHKSIKQAISKIAEQGLTPKAQSGLKALRGLLSKEGLKLAKEKLVVLNVARNELIARLDNLIVNSNLLADTKEVLKTTKNSLTKNLKHDDLVGALRDNFGKDVRRSGDGYTYQHLKEVSQGVESLTRSEKHLLKELSKTVKGSEEFKQLSNEIDAVKEMKRRIGEFLEIK